MPLDTDLVQRILVVKLSSLGDIVHITPCLKALRDHYPHAEIVTAVSEPFVPLLEECNDVDSIIATSAQQMSKWSRLKSIRSQLCPGRTFDIAIDLQGALQSAAWVYASGAKIKMGFGRFRPFWRYRFLPDYSVHAVDEYLNLLRSLGISAKNPAPALTVSTTAEQAALYWLASNGIQRHGYVILNPFSRWQSKSWSPASCVELIHHTSAMGLQWVLTGSTAERKQAESLQALVPKANVCSAVGRLSLAESMAVYKHAKLMVTCDSGPMHAAAALGCRVLALFGPTWPERCGPYGEEHVVIQAARPAHHHAYRTDYAGTHINAVSPATVYRALSSMLQSTTAKSVA